jgi:hypothetical protein
MFAVQAQNADSHRRASPRRSIHPLQQAFIDHHRIAMRFLHAGFSDAGSQRAQSDPT